MKRFLAWILCFMMLFSAAAFAEGETAEAPEVPAMELSNEQLFNLALMNNLSSINPASQQAVFTMEIPAGEEKTSYLVAALPTVNGIALDVQSNGFSVGRLEIGQDRAWANVMGTVYELPFEEIARLMEMFSQNGMSSNALMEAIAPYYENIMAWVGRAAALLAPMYRVTGTDSGVMHVHINLDARQLTNALITLVDEILADEEAVNGILQALQANIPMLASFPLNCEVLKALWSAVRNQLVFTKMNASLVADATINNGGRGIYSMTANGALTINNRQLLFDLSAENRMGSVSVKGSVDGSALYGKRIEFSFNQELDPATRAYNQTGRLDVYSDDDPVYFTLDGTMDSTGYSCTVKGFQDGEMKLLLTSSAHQQNESIDSRVTVSVPDNRDSYLDARLYADKNGVDAFLQNGEAQYSLSAVIDEDGQLSYCRLYADQGYSSDFEEIIVEKYRLIYRTAYLENIATISYPDPTHLVVTFEGTDNYGSPLTMSPSSIVAELTDGEEGELWACVVNGYGAENEVLFTGKLFAANAEPQESLDSTENKIGITAEMILEAAMQLITSAMNQNQSYPTPSQDLP